jgi:hypothetical protein
LGRREKVLRRKSINQLSTGTTTMRRSARAPVGLIESIRIFGKGSGNLEKKWRVRVFEAVAKVEG